MKQKGRISGCICMVLTVLYALWLIIVFSDAISQDLAGAIATAIVTPHMVCITVAGIMSIIGFFAKKRWGMLTCGILLVVGAVVFLPYVYYVIIQAICAFIAFARMGINKE